MAETGEKPIEGAETAPSHNNVVKEDIAPSTAITVSQVHVEVEHEKAIGNPISAHEDAVAAATEAAAAAAKAAANVESVSVAPPVPVPVSVSHTVSVPLPVTSLANAVHLPGNTVQAVHLVPDAGLTTKEEDITQHTTDEIPLVEVAESMMAANDVFTRVKSEKIAEQALCSIRNDQAQYEGLAKEIVGKAIKQKERERANRASAAASRAKVLRYQTELESRLNRMEAERNAYRKEVGELRAAGDAAGKATSEDIAQLARLQELVRKLLNANPEFVKSVIAEGEVGKLLGESRDIDIKEEENPAKRRRI